MKRPEYFTESPEVTLILRARDVNKLEALIARVFFPITLTRLSCLAAKSKRWSTSIDAHSIIFALKGRDAQNAGFLLYSSLSRAKKGSR